MQVVNRNESTPAINSQQKSQSKVENLNSRKDDSNLRAMINQETSMNK